MLLCAAFAVAAHGPKDAPHQRHSLGDFKLESGESIRDFSISYVTHGTLDAEKSNAVLMLTAIGGNHHRIDFLIGPGKALDPAKHFIIATDAIGNGLTTSPSNSKAQPGMQFPRFNIRDMVNSAQPELLQADFQSNMDVIAWQNKIADNWNRADARDWVYQSWAYDQHNVGTTPGFKGDYARALGSIKARTLILAGEGDLLNPEANAREAAQLIPNARYVTIKPRHPMGHVSGAAGFAPENELLNREIAAFLAGIGKR